ncbi:Uncharacterised protein [Mycobacteroides abscessus subsp. abscessus]|nr:Uncharacterised protein [Mycobacteroides abscessus subsp. abscessus]
MPRPSLRGSFHSSLRATTVVLAATWLTASAISHADWP